MRSFTIAEARLAPAAARALHLRTETLLASLDARTRELAAMLSLAEPSDEVTDLLRLTRQCEVAIARCNATPFARELVERLGAKVAAIEARAWVAVSFPQSA